MELIDAAMVGDAACVASLLRNPLSNPNFADDKGFTALMIAAENGHAPVVTLLLGDQRVNPNMTNTQNGNTALMFAARRNYGPVLELLLADHRTIRTLSLIHI